MHGVGGDALGGVDGAGIAETGGVLDVVGGQPDGEPAAVMSDCEVAVLADSGDGPAVAVFDPVGGGEAESPVVAAGDDHIPGTGLVPVGQPHHRIRDVAVEAVVSGAAVQLGDQIAGGGEHDRVQPGRPVGGPSVEGILGGGGEVADVDAAVIEVEVERRRVALAERERRCGFGRVGEAVQLGQLHGAVLGFDVAEDTAGADRGKLLIITDQPDTPTATDHELDGGVEGQRVGHAGFVDDHQRRRPDPRSPIRQVAVLQRPGELGQRVGADAGLLAKDRSRGGGRGKPDHLAAVLGPGQGEGPHGGGLPGAGGGDRQLQPGPGGAHLADQRGLPGIQCGAVRRHLQQGQIDRRLVDGLTPSRRPAVATRRCSASRIRCEV